MFSTLLRRLDLLHGPGDALVGPPGLDEQEGAPDEPEAEEDPLDPRERLGSDELVAVDVVAVTAADTAAVGVCDGGSAGEPEHPAR